MAPGSPFDHVGLNRYVVTQIRRSHERTAAPPAHIWPSTAAGCGRGSAGLRWKRYSRVGALVSDEMLSCGFWTWTLTPTLTLNGQEVVAFEGTDAKG